MDTKFWVSLILTIITSGGLLFVSDYDYINPFVTFLMAPAFLFYLFYRTGILVTGDSKKEIKWLNDLYLKYPRKVRDFFIWLFSPLTKLVGFVDYVLNTFLIGYYKKFVALILKSFNWVVTKVKNFIVYAIKYVTNYINDFINFLQRLFNWVVYRSADYAIAVITFFFNFFFFNIQELLNKYLGSAFRLFGFKFNVIKMPKSFFIF